MTTTPHVDTLLVLADLQRDAVHACATASDDSLHSHASYLRTISTAIEILINTPTLFTPGDYASRAGITAAEMCAKNLVTAKNIAEKANAAVTTAKEELRGAEHARDDISQALHAHGVI